MKKLMTISAVALAVAGAGASSAMASEGFFVGGEFGQARYNFKSTQPNGVVDTQKSNLWQYGLRAGMYVNPNVRVYGNINRGSKVVKKTTDGELGYTSLTGTVSADYILDLGYPVKPFVGATIGGNWGRFDLKAGTTSLSESKFALAYGAQLGVLSEVGPVDVELGYRYLKSNNETAFRVGNTPVGTASGDTAHTPYLAVSYKF